MSHTSNNLTHNHNLFNIVDKSFIENLGDDDSLSNIIDTLSNDSLLSNSDLSVIECFSDQFSNDESMNNDNNGDQINNCIQPNDIRVLNRNDHKSDNSVNLFKDKNFLQYSELTVRVLRSTVGEMIDRHKLNKAMASKLAEKLSHFSEEILKLREKVSAAKTDNELKEISKIKSNTDVKSSVFTTNMSLPVSQMDFQQKISLGSGQSQRQQQHGQQKAQQDRMKLIKILSHLERHQQQQQQQQQQLTWSNNENKDPMASLVRMLSSINSKRC